MSSAVLVLRALLAVVFAVAAVAKLADLRTTRQTMTAFGMPLPVANLAGTLLPIAELATAVALLPQPSARWGAVSAVVLLAIFIAGIVNALSHGRTPDCNCFGQVVSERIGPRTLIRNGVLAAVAGFVVWKAPGSSLSSWSANHSAADLVAVLALIGCALLAVLAIRYRQKSRELGQWLNRTTRELSTLPSGLPLGLRAPKFELPDLSGRTVSLERLCGRARPVMLVFTSPTCGPCIRLKPDLERWQGALAERVTFAVVAVGPGQAQASDQGSLLTLVQKGQEVLDQYRVRSTPTAVVVGPDGRIASGFASGNVEIEELVRVTLNRASQETPPPHPLLVEQAVA